MNDAERPQPSARLESVDFLRGLAILAVIAIHAPHYAHGGWREHPWFLPAFLMNYGYLGVHLFVMISGFCIHLRAARNRRMNGEWDFSWSQFWRRRIWRLYPTYLVAIGVGLLLAHLIPAEARNSTHEYWGWDLITHLLLIHNLTGEYATTLGNGVYWSLGMEEQLYALYFILLLLFRRRSHCQALIVISVVTISWRLLTPSFPASLGLGGPLSLGTWHLWPFMFWLHWALGALAVDFYVGNISLPKWMRSLPLILTLMFLGMLLNKNAFQLASRAGTLQLIIPAPLQLLLVTVGELLFAGSFFCLMTRYVLQESDDQWKHRLRPIAAVGRISYSTYLVHAPLLGLQEYWLRVPLSAVGWPVSVGISFLLSIGFGGLFYWLVERHFVAAPHKPSQTLVKAVI